MSSVTVVNLGETSFLTLLTDIDMTLRLYVNDVTAGLTDPQIEALTVAAFTEASFAGYAAVSMTTAWTVAAGDPAQATRSPVTFTRSSTGVLQQVYGYHVTRNSDGALMWFENFDAPVPMEFLNDAITVTPKLTLDDDTGRNRVDMEVFTSSGTWTKPVGLKAAHVRLVGGGGSGGGTEATGVGAGADGGGGGGGGYSEELFLADELAATVAVTIGAGGTAASAGAAGSAGGTTTFGAHCSGTGGAGGAAGVDTTTNQTSLGGAGGAGSGGDLNVPGDSGRQGIVVDGAPKFQGAGGGSMLGQSITHTTAASSNGNAGLNYGGGSTGAVAGASQAARPSTAGAPGVLIVTEYF